MWRAKNYKYLTLSLILGILLTILGYVTFTNAAGVDGQNAEGVIGQIDSAGAGTYVSGTINNPINRGMNQPYDSAIDATNHIFYAVDKSNNRVLVYNLNSNNSFPDYIADYVVGQSNFVPVFANKGGASPTDKSLSGPRSVALDSSGRLYIADASNNRVMVYNSITASDQSAIFVIGAADFTSTNSGRTVSNKRMITPSGVSFSGTPSVDLKIYISDVDTNRVLVFNEITGNDQTADKALGQGDFTSSSLGTSDVGLGNPTGVTSDNSKLYVSDKTNNRVMIWNLPIASNGQAANLVLGQTWFNSNSSGTSASQLNQPFDVSINADSDLFVSDSSNNRVMVYSSDITSNGQSADYVIGQSNFTTSTSGTSSTKYNNPLGISTANGSILFVADANNNRIMGYTSSITSNGQSANYNVGQTNTSGQSYFYGNAANNPINRGLDTPSSSSLDTVHHKLFVADTGNNRVLIYNLNTDDTLPDGYSDLVLGQQDFSRSSSNRGGSVNAGTLSLAKVQLTTPFRRLATMFWLHRQQFR
ncbi:MAG: NHL repeat-containing protein [Chloroflexi bacterium]|nr:NHL repeat-containing protein [Chloroflexota bacterium]